MFSKDLPKRVNLKVLPEEYYESYFPQVLWFGRYGAYERSIMFDIYFKQPVNRVSSKENSDKVTYYIHYNDNMYLILYNDDLDGYIKNDVMFNCNGRVIYCK